MSGQFSGALIAVESVAVYPAKRGASRMLAAADWPEIRNIQSGLSQLRAQIPRSVFRAAYQELCTRIWMELETLGQAAGQLESIPPQDLVMSTAILRLELVVLVDFCRSQRWRCMLSAEQRDCMCSLLTDLLAALYVDPEDLSTGIAQAQSRVFDELPLEAETGIAWIEAASA
ncbi:MAG: hypothetical protein JO203_12820 [Gammaproteobacteria bacterium]|nr:hypothetical protein [Gammaproteobacteria bacterium]